MKSLEQRYATFLKAVFVGPKTPLNVKMNVRLDGGKRPVCTDCNHSIMQHGERNQKVFCWGCATIKKVGTCNDGQWSNFNEKGIQ